MRTLIATAIVSRDGFCIGPNGGLPSPPWSRALGDESLATLDRADAILYGRLGFARDLAFWQRADIVERPIARLLARYPKLVCSTTLAGDLDWNATVVRDRAQLVAHKAAPGKAIVVFGCPTLLAGIADLVDEIRTIVTPHDLGAGIAWPAFDRPLVEERALGTAILRTYQGGGETLPPSG